MTIKKSSQFIITWLLMLSPCLAGAQASVYLGLQTGLALANLQSANQSSATTLRPGFSAEVLGDFGLSKKLSLIATGGYVEQGCKNFTYPAYTYPPVYPGLNSTTNLYYLKLAVDIKYTLWASATLKWYMHGGGYAAYLVASNLENSFTRASYSSPATLWQIYATENSDTKTDIPNTFKKPDFGAQIGTGLAKTLGRSTVFIDISGSYGLLNILQPNYQNQATANSSGFVKLGYSYALKHKTKAGK